ncbi:MAG: helix-turn-helix domain-containing protein [Actinomycetia bacterium]|nr:helix-turn-helix domain-containing protein [Actinomycetes bacterium]
MITVVDPDAARRALLAGLLSCPEPGCDGALRVWSRARTRQVRRLDGELITLRPDRARRRGCAVTQVLLPVWCLPRRGYGVDVVGAALLAAAKGAGHRRAAACVEAPADTVRGWLRAVRADAPALTARAVEVAHAEGTSLFPPGPLRGGPGGPCPRRCPRWARRLGRSPCTCRPRGHAAREDA